LNINNNNALGSGTLTLTAGTINNTSGSAVINAGTNAISLGNLTTFGTTSSTTNNNLDLGTGTVTTASSPVINFAGTNTTLKMGLLDSTLVATSATGSRVTANNSGSGIGNTLSFAGFKLGSQVTNAVVDSIYGNANVAFRGAIVNGAAYNNGISIANTATTTFAGDNTYTGLTTMNAAAGTLTLSGNNSAASGGVSLTAGTLNINNNNALGSGALTLTAGTINNTSGAAVVNAGSNDVTWSSGFTFGTAGSTATNNLNLGMGKVTASTAARSITFAGTNTILTMGILDCSYPTYTASGVIYTADGPGNTLVINGYNIRSESIASVADNIVGSANWTFNGVIANGNASANGLNIKSTGATTFNGTNTYTGKTVVYSNATLRVNGSLVSPVTVTSNGIIGGTGTISALTVSTNGILEAALNSTWNTAGTLTFATNSIVRVVGGTPSGSTPYTLVVAATSISTNTMPILNPSFSGWELAVVGGTNLVLRTTGGGGDTTAPVITVNGQNPVTVAQGSVYSDAGATTDDGSAVAANIPASITSTVGSKTVTYNSVDASGNNATQKTRTVNVTDQTVPLLALNGANPLSVSWGGAFTDPGASFTDNVDASKTVISLNTVDTSKVGSTTLTYSAVDAGGNAAVNVTRTVIVTLANGGTTVGADGLSDLMRYALGGTSPSSKLELPTVAVTSTTLTMNALIRINDPKVSVVGEYGLTPGTWVTGSPIAGVPSSSQAGAVAGVTQRQDFNVDRGTDAKKFMHLKATLAP
jgi:hypothetical protein